MIRQPPPAADMQFTSLCSVSPSFTSHSSNNLADIAARVVEEFRNEHGHEDDEDIYNFVNNDVYTLLHDEPANNRTENLKENEEQSDEEFEFAVISTAYNSPTASANEIYFNGEIVTRYPLFDRSLLLNDAVDKYNESDGKSETVIVSPVARRSLRKLFQCELDSCSSSEADDLEGIAPETYCIWKPKAESETNCKKSNSTGSCSKRWSFRNLVHRSNSAGRLDSGKNGRVIVFRQLTATKKRSETAKVAGADDNEINFANKTVKEGNRNRSYGPYKPNLVGVFANVNGLSWNLHPF